MKRIVTMKLFLSLLFIGATLATAQTLTVQGTPVTGLNRLLGEPVWNFGPLGTVGFETVGGLDPEGDEPLALSSTTARNTLLATIVDPFWLRVTGFTPAEVANLDNVYLRNVPIVVDPFGGRAPLAPLNAGTQLQFTRAESNGLITLGKWLRARGQMRIQCSGSRGPRVHMQFQNLVANGVYSVWAGFETQFNGAPFLGIGPLGGVPNSFVTDDRGSATFERSLNFCPMDLKEGEVPLLFVDVVYHSDGSLYGARPALPRVKLFSGTVSHSQLEFLLSGTAAD